MKKVLQVGDRTILAEEIISLLAQYKLLPKLLREIIIEQAIAPFNCTDEEQEAAVKQFYERNQLTSEKERLAWVTRYGMTLSQLDALAIRDLKIEKFKQATWGQKLESYFLAHKSKLDKVIYSLLRTKDAGIAQELYFRIKEGEQSFAECAREYSQGPEAETSGLVGPVDLGTPHPMLAKMLSVSQPGQLWPPTRLGDWLLIVRLEKFIPAQLDTSTRQHLLNRLFDTWLNEKINQEMRRGGDEDREKLQVSDVTAHNW